jgi:membrane associated rhomboid family serine protease
VDSEPRFDLVEIFHSPARAACDERAFVLHAVGIGSQVAFTGRHWRLFVDAADTPNAATHLVRYEHENPPRRRFIRPEGTHAWAWVGAASYAAAMLGVAYLAGHRAFAANWLAAGVVDTAAVRGGEWWRALTALTLHFDVAHLLANLGFGAAFLWLASQLLGPGVALGAVVAAASLANLVDAYLQPLDHVSAGASTAVFATLGMLAAYSWRRRADDGGRWAYRWAPLIAGVFMLAFTGAAGENTDVLAHLTGFVVGGTFGVVLATRQPPFRAAAQWLAGLGAAAAIAAAWCAALQ